MATFFAVHPDNPQPRLLQQAAQTIQKGGIIIYPTDAAYSLGCSLNNKAAMEKMLAIRHINTSHPLTLMCADLAQAGMYTKINNQQFRILKATTPNPFTFILEATKDVPNRVIHPKHKSIGLRIPAHTIAQNLIHIVGEPILSCTLILPEESSPLTDPYEMRDLLQHQVDLIIDGGWCGNEMTTVINLIDQAQIIRHGLGDITLVDL